ncbi:response regulator transcription factor [Janthinobacterium sp. 17J80-10]|uniref:response regulator transcription factor n=1 Tax=Janthinobacterium sp. 17J80-10 TaxID=2497863 RepID=UPI0013E8CB6A|nr:response regulator transcription factor [Janthinobacterium sp. 17J80-10]
MTKVLLVDDDVELIAMFKDYLEREGFDVAAQHDGQSGVEAALTGHYAIAVLDVMMPKMNGVDALRRIRHSSNIPILMLTAKGDDTDKIIGLELGADDYVPKPCTPRELTARIRAILRRMQPVQSASPESEPAAPILVGQLAMWLDKRRAEWDGKPLDLTSTEFNLLEILARNAGHTVSKAALSEEGLGRTLSRFDRNIDVHLSSLRQKLGTLSDGRSSIQTVYRQGYQFIRE